ncbi:MAG: hypothetical protein AUJ57_11205 [Zetaproteobacteria bacterium CG1_02_53_45]|nr:MAG: hypothetical protein AUJ57_11205 [Zetaproteobacteria bacterium CG1_02_53_45]
MLKIMVALLISVSLFGCGTEQNESQSPEQIPKTIADDLGRDIADAALALSIGNNHAEAFKLFQQAAELGNRPAYYYLGLYYGRGDVVEKDFDQAFKWLHKAAMGGYPKAAYHVAEMYVRGEGVAEDHVKALAWYWVGASLGDRYSEKRLRAVVPRLDPVQMGHAKTMSKELYAAIPHDLKEGRMSLH